MPDVQRRCWLYSAHWQQCVGAALCWLPAVSEAFGLVRGQLPFLAVVAILGLKGLEIPRYWEWGLDCMQGLCLCGVVVDIVVVHYALLPLDYC